MWSYNMSELSWEWVLLIVATLAAVGVLIYVVTRPRKVQQRIDTIQSQSIVARPGTRQLTAEESEQVMRAGAEQNIARVKALMAELKAKFEDPSACDLSNIEQAVAEADAHFNEKRYGQAWTLMTGPSMALRTALEDLQMNFGDRPGAKLVSMSVSVKSGRSDD
jgi:hypothetical protein